MTFRKGLWDQGLGLAEAMDTAQRGMGVDWLTAKELIERTMAAAKDHELNPRVACGAGTDHKGLDILTDFTQGDLALFRRFELAAALNRLRTLKIMGNLDKT